MMNHACHGPAGTGDRDASAGSPVAAAGDRAAAARRARLDLPGALGASVLCLALYLYTLAPGMVWGDSGEIITAVYRLGTMHPTGYPLYTLLGHLFTRLPLPFLTVAGRVNLLSALCGAAAVSVLYLILLDLTSSRPASAAGSLLFGLSPLFWAQCRMAEVYSLHILLAAVLLLVIVRLARDPTPRLLFLFAFCTGLSFAHHMMTVLLAPAALYLVLATARGPFLKPSTLARMCILFLCPLALYGYLFFSYRLDAGITWGGVRDAGSFLRHVTGAQYRHHMLSGLDPFLGNFVRYVKETVFGFSLFLPFALVGSVSLFRRDREIGIFTLVYFLTSLIYALNYQIPDIAPYFLPSHLVLGLWGGCGVAAVLGRARRDTSGRLIRVALAQIVLVLIGWTALVNAIDLKGKGAEAEEFARRSMAAVTPDSIILAQGDGYIFGLWYAQYVLRLGRDCVVIAVPFCKRDWYIEMIERRHPQLRIERSETKQAFARGILEGNPGRDVFSINTFSADVDLIPGYDVENLGWIDRVRFTGEPRGRPIYVRAAFLCSRGERSNGKGVGHAFRADAPVSLVVDWALRSPGAKGEVVWVDPDGQRAGASPFDVPAGTARSLVPMEGVRSPRKAGTWTVQVLIEGFQESSQRFEIHGV